jgi:DNA-binding PadR family transcriptional regulator
MNETRRAILTTLELDIEKNPNKYPLQNIYNYSSLEKLDFVLKYLNNKNHDSKISIYEIKINLRVKGYQFSKYNDELEKLLNKLEKDEFVQIDYEDENSTEKLYSITFEGECLLEEEKGYVGRDKKIKTNKTLELMGAIGLALISGILGNVIGNCQSQYREDRQSIQEIRKFDSLKALISRDTIHINILSQKPDTSLVRLVKTKQTKK